MAKNPAVGMVEWPGNTSVAITMTVSAEVSSCWGLINRGAARPHKMANRLEAIIMTALV